MSQRHAPPSATTLSAMGGSSRRRSVLPSSSTTTTTTTIGGGFKLKGNNIGIGIERKSPGTKMKTSTAGGGGGGGQNSRKSMGGGPVRGINTAGIIDLKENIAPNKISSTMKKTTSKLPRYAQPIEKRGISPASSRGRNNGSHSSSVASSSSTTRKSAFGGTISNTVAKTTNICKKNISSSPINKNSNNSNSLQKKKYGYQSRSPSNKQQTTASSSSSSSSSSSLSLSKKNNNNFTSPSISDTNTTSRRNITDKTLAFNLDNNNNNNSEIANDNNSAPISLSNSERETLQTEVTNLKMLLQHTLEAKLNIEKTLESVLKDLNMTKENLSEVTKNHQSVQFELDIFKKKSQENDIGMVTNNININNNNNNENDILLTTEEVEEQEAFDKYEKSMKNLFQKFCADADNKLLSVDSLVKNLRSIDFSKKEELQ